LSVNWGEYKNHQATITNLAEQASEEKTFKWIQTATYTEYDKSMSKCGSKCDAC